MRTFEDLAEEIGRLVTDKNRAYGNSFVTVSKVLEILFPDGIPVSKYQDVLLFARMWDKLSRIATDENAFGESPYKDLCGYSLLGWSSSEAKKTGQ